MVIEAIQFLFSIFTKIFDLMSKFMITENVSFLHLLLAFFIIVAFIKLLTFQVEDHGIEVFKSYHAKQVKSKQASSGSARDLARNIKERNDS